MTVVNEKLKNDLEASEGKLKKSEASLSHQIKVTKNLELVLERLQNGKHDCKRCSFLLILLSLFEFKL